MRTRVQMDEIGENVRRARAIARLAQVGADQNVDLSIETCLALCVVEDLLGQAVDRIESMAAR